MTPEKPQEGRYRLRRLLGQGSMGKVYLAEDTRIQRQVAIKIIRTDTEAFEDVQQGKEALRLFEREMKAISRLDHPHILALYDYGEMELQGTRVAYMVMPYRDGGSLDQWLSLHHPSPLTPQELLPFLRQAADALQYAHDRQIVHQDVKLSNFLVRQRPEKPLAPDLFLADFGIARFTLVSNSMSQSVRGTPISMAPEQWRGQVLPASDQYALSVMVYTLLTGHSPFQGSAWTLMYQHLHASPASLSSFNPALSRDLDAVLRMALEKRPSKRFASISAFASAFEQACQSAAPVSAPLPRLDAFRRLPQFAPPAHVLPSPAEIVPPAQRPMPGVPKEAKLGIQRLVPLTAPLSESSPLPVAGPAEAQSKQSSITPPMGVPIQPGFSALQAHPTPVSSSLSGPLAFPHRIDISEQITTRKKVRPTMRRRTVVLLSALAAALLLSTLVGIGFWLFLPAQQVFRFAMSGGSISTFDPALGADVSSDQAIEMVFTGLVAVDNNLNVRPQLADSWQISSDGLTYTFHLKHNLKFSDGTPLTATDVVYSINRAINPTTDPGTRSLLGFGYLGLIKDADKLRDNVLPTLIGDSLLAPDPNTVQIVITRRASYFLDALSYNTSFVVERKLIDNYGNAVWTNHLTEGGGDGPWMVQSWTHDKEIVLVPNPNYYGTKPRLTKMVITFYEDSDKTYQAYQNGQQDLSFVPSASLVQARTGQDFHEVPSLSIFYYAMNYLAPPFDNINIRKAFAAALDKDMIAHTIWQDSVLPTNHIVPLGMPGYYPDLKGVDGTFSTHGNPQAAQDFLHQGLAEKGLTSVSQLPPITLTYATSPGVDKETKAVIQTWKTVLGIQVRTNPIDSNTLFDLESKTLTNPQGLQLWIIGWGADYPDPQDWTTLQFDNGAGLNYVNYGQTADQQATQKAMEQADAMDQGPARLAAYNQIEQQLVNNVAWLPIYQEQLSYVLKPWVQGLVFNAEEIFSPDSWGNVYIAPH